MLETHLGTRTETWTNLVPLRIAGRVLGSLEIVVARLEQGEACGEGEAAGVYYHGDTVEGVRAAIAALAEPIRNGLDRTGLQAALPPGGARNALDCAFWALESRLARTPVWRLAGLDSVRPLLTTFTIGAEAPVKCEERAAHWVGRGARALKLKMCGDGEDLARVRQVRRAAPGAWIGVDANQGWTMDALAEYACKLADLGVSLVEQPLPVGEDEKLRGWCSPVPLAADESFQDRRDLERLAGVYDVANIKLDKTGGLTEALACVVEGKRLGYRMMVGNMAGTSLAMAPAFVVGQHCDMVDLDGPIYFAADREPATVYENGLISRPQGWDWHDGGDALP